MKAQLVVAALAGLAGGLVGSVAVQREGDSSAKLQAFEQKLDAAFKAKLVLSTETRPGEQLVKCRVSAPDGRGLVISFGVRRVPNEGPTPLCQAVGTLLAASGSSDPLTRLPPELSNVVREATLVAPPWSEVESLGESLYYFNRDTARGKALVRYPGMPQGAELDWNNRHAMAAKAWLIEEPSAFLAKRAGAVVAGLVAGFLAAFLALALLAWTWRFLLARIRELSSAVRGK